MSDNESAMQSPTTREGARPYRIGLGGIAIESSTFSPLRTSAADFTILRGNAMLARYPFMPAWRFHGRDDILWLPTLHAKAIPGGPVLRASYDAMKHELLERIAAALPLDGFYLDIHGAMSVDGMEDAEADLAAAVRELIGPACVISACTDLHGNISARFVELVDAVATYRTAPHVDELETREKAFATLLHCLDHGVRPVRGRSRIPVMLPGERTSTMIEPARSLYAALSETDRVPGILDAALFVGYVWADEPRSGACVVVTGTDADAVRRESEKIARRYWDARDDFGFIAPVDDIDGCIRAALGMEGGPVFISDSGDNPTAGGAGDVPMAAGRLVEMMASAGGGASAVYASIPDHGAVESCARAGEGAEVTVMLGGKLDPVHGRPLELRGVVERIRRSDPVGGDIAVLRVGSVRIIITSRRKPFHHIADFSALGIDPSEEKIVMVKIGYLEPELRGAARHALLALTPGAVNQDIPSLTYRRVVRPIYPLDPELAEADLAEADLRATIFPPING